MSVAFRFATLFSVALAISVPVGAASAQQGTINGRVTDAETGEPLAGASVEALGQGSPQGSNEEGRFTLTVAAGSHSVVVKLIGYETTRIDDVSVAAGATAEVDIPVRSQALVLNPVIVTGSPPPGEDSGRTRICLHGLGGRGSRESRPLRWPITSPRCPGSTEHKPAWLRARWWPAASTTSSRARC